ncbi:MAG: PilN domain-containing protein [Candidatus Krumholzibacteriota bacterium]|nr:PilN domain-containing protein [Candidatus Krumholzibacteriota bacterium]
MIRVNLLPVEERPRPRQLPLPSLGTAITFGALFIVTLAAGLSWTLQGRQLTSLNERLARAVQEEQRLVAQTQAIEQLETREAMLAERLQLVRQLESGRFDNIEWLNALNGVMPGRLWLQQATRNQTGTQTTLEGIAEGYRPIAELMRAMEASGRFGTVQLVRAERHSAAAGAMIHFTVAASWRTPHFASTEGTP